MTFETPAWIIDNPTERHPTEILVPLVTKVGPVWSHSGSRGGWYAGLEVLAGNLDVDELWACDHVHSTQDEAWDCAEGAALQLAEAVLERATSGQLRAIIDGGNGPEVSAPHHPKAP